MVATSTRFQSEKAPCGQVVSGEQHQEQDEDGLVTDDRFYDCGCRRIRHEYHDGSFCLRVVRHDGTVLAEEMDAEHHP
jgi:hypothetical protein